MNLPVSGTKPDDSPGGAERGGRKRWPNRLVFEPREFVGGIFPVPQKTSQPRAVMLIIILVILAIATAAFLAYQLNQAFGLVVPLAILCGISVGIFTLLVNLYCATSEDSGKGFRRTRPIIIVAVFIGTILSFATTMQGFHGRALSEWLRSSEVKEMSEARGVSGPISAYIKNRKESVNKLDERRKNLEGKNIDEDPTIVPVLANYREIKNEYDKADEGYRCALNVLCVALSNYKGISVDELGGRRNRLQLSHDSAKRKLDDAERETKARISNEIADCRKKIDDENNEIKELEGYQKGLVNDRFESFISFLSRSDQSWKWFVGLLIIYAVILMVPAFFPKDDLQKFYKRRALEQNHSADDRPQSARNVANGLVEESASRARSREKEGDAPTLGEGSAGLVT